MTEAEWLGSYDPPTMLQFLRANYGASDRKQRLLSVACCRQIGNLLTDERSQKAVEVAEQFAEDQTSTEELAHAHQAAQEACTKFLNLANKWDDCAMAAGAVADASYSGAAFVVSVSYRSSTLGDIGSDKESLSRARRSVVAELVRDVFGNPFCPVAFSPSWRTDTVVTLARLMYEAREFSAMPILADALQDAGCDNADILAHCRGDGPHVRGCWVVDLVLGKE
jgi:hypothetical protein